MTGTMTPAFVRQDLVAPRPAPVVTTGIVGFVRTRLLNSPTNIALTLASLAVLWITLVPAIRFLLVDAVWQGSSRDACLAGNAGHPVGACWPFIAAKFDQLIYGFYPASGRWRVNLTFLVAALLLAPLLMPKVPGKTPNAILFFVAYPFLAFFLLYGGGIGGFGVTWTADAAAAVADSLAAVAAQLSQAGVSGGLAHLVPVGAGGLLSLLAHGLAVAIRPLVALRNLIQSSPHAVWLDLGVTALAVSVVLFVVNGALRTGWRALAVSLASFAGVAVVIAVMGLDRGGLPVVDTRQWGGLLVTLVVSVTGIVASMPVGIALALGRRASLPLIRIGSVIFIEFWRGVPLITVLFFATYMLPLFLPGNVTVDGLVRVLIGVALFSGAYNAEVIRGGLQAIPRGQRARPVLLEDHEPRRAAPGAASRHSRAGQQLHRPVQGHHPGADRGDLRSAGIAAGGVFRSGLGDADHTVHRLCLHRPDLLRFLFRDVALFAVHRASPESEPADLIERVA
jgi:general L-amino acid transport system permease protein